MTETPNSTEQTISAGDVVPLPEVLSQDEIARLLMVKEREAAAATDEAAAAKEAEDEAAREAKEAADVETARVASIVNAANIALSMAATVIQRCGEESIKTPKAWSTYQATLQKIASGATDTPMPEMPPFPDGLLVKNLNGQHVPMSKDEQAAITATWAANDANAAADALRSEARALLETSDLVAIRCAKAGVAYPDAWRAYDAALRAIVTSGTGTIPARPEYPAGT